MQLLWTSGNESAWNFYGMSDNIYQGKLITWGYGGELMAYDIQTGHILWNYTSKSVGLESWYGNTPISGAVIADGKIYIYSTEHSPSQPYRRDAMIKCVNTTTGEEIWNVTHWAITAAISDGYLVALNYYDNSVYCYGRGPSATTVTADPKVARLGNKVLIEGTVTDQSPGGRQDESGVVVKALKDSPAISDEFMGKWMEYWYAQRPMPEDAKGVNVTLSIVDPNNNYFELGTATSDLTGQFAYAFTPQVPGTYQVIAKFAGTGSYGPSFAHTFLTVGEEAVTPTATVSAQPVSVSEQYFIPAIIGIFAAIAIVGALLLIVLLKKKA
jgi:PQQ-like domain